MTRSSPRVPAGFAVGKGGVSVGTVKGNVIKEGDGEREIHAQQYVEKQYVGAGSGGNTGGRLTQPPGRTAPADRYLERLRRQCHAVAVGRAGRRRIRRPRPDP